MRENLELGAYLAQRQGADRGATWSAAFELFPRLSERLEQNAGTLSGGEQQMLAIARALMSQPAGCCCSTSPRSGLAPLLVQTIFETIEEINRRGHDHPAGRAERAPGAQARHRGYVLEQGAVALTGPAAEWLRTRR